MPSEKWGTLTVGAIESIGGEPLAERSARHRQLTLRAGRPAVRERSGDGQLSTSRRAISDRELVQHDIALTYGYRLKGLANAEVFLQGDILNLFDQSAINNSHLNTPS